MTEQTSQQVRANYQETSGEWMVAVGHHTDGTDRGWDVDEWIDPGPGTYTGWHDGREPAAQAAERVASERHLDLLPPYDTVGQP